MSDAVPAPKPRLNDPNVTPDETVLLGELKESYPAYEAFMQSIANFERDLSPEWRYYKDGGAWLCKVVRRKTTICWLSIWDGFLRVVFYFTEKHANDIAALPISDPIKKSFIDAKPIGKLIPLGFEIQSTEQLPDLLKVIDYKVSVAK